MKYDLRMDRESVLCGENREICLGHLQKKVCMGRNQVSEEFGKEGKADTE